MINKAIYTLWLDPRQKINQGYENILDLFCCLSLSVELAKQQFEKVELVCNSTGKSLLIDQLQIPFTSYNVALDQFDNKLDPDHWALAKMYSYSIQNEPFLHIDTDVFIFSKIPQEVLQKDLIFQNKEMLDIHGGYLVSLEKYRKLRSKLQSSAVKDNVQYAYNCGVVGANNLDVIKQWYSLASSFVEGEEYKTFWEEQEDKHRFNHFFEQYFIACLVDQNKELSVESLLGDLLIDRGHYSYSNKEFLYTHLWGEVKRDRKILQKVYSRLLTSFPQYKTHPYLNNPSQVFSHIYKTEAWGKGLGSGSGSTIQVTDKYNKELCIFIKENLFKSILDLGCGDWQSTQFIDFQGASYLGIDCVSSIIDENIRRFSNEQIKFELGDIFTYVPNQIFDIVLLKDVLIHWPNSKIIEFFTNFKSCKYFIITNQISEHNNIDIVLGSYHSLDLEQEPFNMKFEGKWLWRDDSKVTYVLKCK